jgi:integration host factor subunit beta
MPQTKAAIIQIVAIKMKLPIGGAEAIVNRVFDVMAEALVRGEGIEVRGFGSFTVREYRAYDARNPRTGMHVHVEKKRLPFFRVGKELRRLVNNGRTKNATSESQRTRIRPL